MARAFAPALVLLLAAPATAQVNPAQAGADAAARDQARRAAEAAAAERAQRDAAPDVRLGGAVPALGPFPVETPCFPMRDVVIDGALPHRLGFVRRRLDRFRGRCIGQQGLNYVLRSLQAAFLDRGLITTRAGLPQQDLSSGVLHVAIIPGVEAKVVGGSARARRAWSLAAPLHPGDLVSLRALEQGVEQMRRVPGRAVSADLAPGAAPGESDIDLTVHDPFPIHAAISVDDFAGRTVGRWQATGQLTAADLLGLNEVVSGYYNRRLDSPSLPADSRGTGGSLSIPFGWWTAGIAGSANTYSQRVAGAVQDFDTRGTLATVSAYVGRVIHRDRVSTTSLQVQLQRRWARNYIQDIEIGLQHQDVSDVQIAAIDHRRFGAVQFDGVVAGRFGIGLFGAMKDDPGLPSTLPSARYRIVTADLSLAAPLASGLGYRAAFRAQWSPRALYGSDSFTVGGPYTVRGYDSDTALISRSGFYLRQELSAALDPRFQPYALFDLGRAYGYDQTPIGVGAGIRAQWRGATLDAYLAVPLGNRAVAPGAVRPPQGQFGLSVGLGF